jgi:hypothetical protein
MAKMQKNCGNCLNGINNNFNTDIICRYKGVVTRDFCCFKHRLNPYCIGAFNKTAFHCIDCSFLIVEPENESASVGYCQLFTVRKFDGSKKKTCSKFELKSKQGAYA